MCEDSQTYQGKLYEVIKTYTEEVNIVSINKAVSKPHVMLVHLKVFVRTKKQLADIKYF